MLQCSRETFQVVWRQSRPKLAVQLEKAIELLPKAERASHNDATGGQSRHQWCLSARPIGIAQGLTQRIAGVWTLANARGLVYSICVAVKVTFGNQWLANSLT